MIGEGYWSTGITVEYHDTDDGMPGWTAWVDFLDTGYATGVLRTYQFTALAVVIDMIKVRAEQIGVTWKSPAIYYKGDGVVEDINDLDAPEGWLQMLREQAQRLGWASGRRYVEQGTERCTR